MIDEIGHFALVLALCIAALQSVVPLIGAARNDPALMAWARPAALAQFLFVGIAFFALMHGYVVSDFSLANVAANSSSMKPLLYKLSGVWSNHEGSMLLWVFILALFGAAVATFGHNLPPGLRARVLAVQAMIGVGFLLFILLTSNPFQRLWPIPLDGNGLNPLLQDPGLAFHPPFLYLGYVGFSMAFSFAVAALIEGRVDAAWARWVRPWTLAAWCALTTGIAMGSWWAYYTLGWGGWWFWDPVENASFMPWLVGTALLHSAIVVEKRDALKSWTILLAIVTFSLSLVGTFLVLSVGFPFFNRTFVPLMVPALIAVAAGPLLAWKRGDLLGALQRLWLAFAAVIAVAAIGLYLTRGGPVLAVLGLALAAWVFTAALSEWAERVKLLRAPLPESWRRALSLPRAAHGMTLAHLGLAVAVAGIAASAFENERIEVLHQGEALPIAAYVLHLDGVAKAEGPNYSADRATITVSRGGEPVAVMHPEKRFFPVQQMPTSMTAIHTNLLADLYVALGDSDGSGGWTVRAYWKPLVPWIWLGAVLMALGGLVSLSDRLWRVGIAARRARRASAAQPAAE